MEYISVTQFAEKYGISERTIRNYCATGKIDGAFLTGKTWNIPSDALLSAKGKRKISPLLARLREENINGYLRDTCLSAQDDYKALLDYFKIKY